MYKNWASYIAQQAKDKSKVDTEIIIKFKVEVMEKITELYPAPWEIIDGSKSGYACIKSGNNVVLSCEGNSPEEAEFLFTIVNVINKL